MIVAFPGRSPPELGAARDARSTAPRLIRHRVRRHAPLSNGAYFALDEWCWVGDVDDGIVVAGKVGDGDDGIGVA